METASGQFFITFKAPLALNNKKADFSAVNHIGSIFCRRSVITAVIAGIFKKFIFFNHFFKLIC